MDCLGGATRPPVAGASSSSASPRSARRSCVATTAPVGALLLLLSAPLERAGLVVKAAGEEEALDLLGIDWNIDEDWSKPPYFFRFAVAFSRSDAISASSCTKFHSSFALHAVTVAYMYDKHPDRDSACRLLLPKCARRACNQRVGLPRLEMYYSSIPATLQREQRREVHTRLRTLRP